MTLYMRLLDKTKNPLRPALATGVYHGYTGVSRVRLGHA